MKLFLGILCTAAITMMMATAQTSSTTTTTATQGSQTTSTTMTESVGTISEYSPGTTIVLNTGSGEPMRYKLGKNVTYVNAKGKVIDASKMRKDRKVRVHYVKEGNDMIVDKVTVVRD